MIFLASIENPPPPGHWTATILDGEKTIKITCPQCGASGPLTNHDINAEGVVSPSIECTGEDCDFHEFIMLADWP